MYQSLLNSRNSQNTRYKKIIDKNTQMLKNVSVEMYIWLYFTKKNLKKTFMKYSVSTNLFINNNFD